MNSNEDGLAAPAVGKGHDAYRELWAEISAKLDATGESTKGGAWALLKSALLISNWVFWYAVVLAVGTVEPALALLLTPIAAFSVVVVMFAVMHDGSHGAMSEASWLNRLAANTLPAAGGSAVSWHHEHVVAHHRHTNVKDLDPDLETGGILRFHPSQPWRPLHRFQHLYAWLAYSLVSLKWAWFEDFDDLLRNRYGLAGSSRARHFAEVVLAKSVHVALYIVVPSVLWGVGWALVFYLLHHVVVGLIMATVFVLAHVTGEQSMPDRREDSPEDWALFQLATTSDFATGNRFLTFCLGGLNMQVEHHLFPTISHRHYPWIRRHVRAWAERHEVPYSEHPTLFAALCAHAGYLRRLGQRPVATISDLSPADASG